MNSSMILVGEFINLDEYVEERETIGSFSKAYGSISAGLKGKYAVYVNADEGETIPHIHIVIDKNPDPRDEVCCKLYNAEFFPHKKHKRTNLNGKECKLLNDFLHSKIKSGNDTSITYWDYALNMYNDKNHVRENFQYYTREIPDYRKLDQTMKYTYYRITQDGDDIYHAIQNFYGRSRLEKFISDSKYPKLFMLSADNVNTENKVWYTYEGYDIIMNELLPAVNMASHATYSESRIFINSHTHPDKSNSSQVTKDTPYQVRVK